MFSSYSLKIMPGKVDISGTGDGGIQMSKESYQEYVKCQIKNYKRAVEIKEHSLTPSSNFKLYNDNENMYVSVSNQEAAENDFQFLPDTSVQLAKIYTGYNVSLCIFVDGKKYYLTKGKKMQNTRTQAITSKKTKLMLSQNRSVSVNTPFIRNTTSVFSPAKAKKEESRIPGDFNISENDSLTGSFEDDNSGDYSGFLKKSQTMKNNKPKEEDFRATVKVALKVKKFEIGLGNKNEALEFHCMFNLVSNLI